MIHQDVPIKLSDLHHFYTNPNGEKLGSAKSWKKIQRIHKFEANQQTHRVSETPLYLKGTYIPLAENEGASMQRSHVSSWGNRSGHLPRICHIWWWVCVSWIYVIVWPCDVDSVSLRFHLDVTSWLKPKIGLPATTKIGWKWQMLVDARKTCCFPHCSRYTSQTFSEGQVGSWSLHLPYPTKVLPGIKACFYLHCCWWECSPHRAHML